ncbi:hypothetical protein [Sphingomonas sp. PAMC 26605]|uniref:hypothetical protein n=1 Tax=Sphingomonas sp. PAMC 26605 TaxID=1112214 RepID=UPI00026CA6D6|nr:hypothetical protein [Sphingomonas sp. PAMC 26605]
MKLRYAIPAALAGLVVAGSANAAGLTTTGTIPSVCKVDVTQRAFDPQKTTIQNIAGVVLTCNNAGNHSVTVDAQNGYFAGPSATQVDYTMTMDLDGNLLPFNNLNLTSAPVSSPVGAPDANLAAGLPGNFSVTLLSKPFLAGAYSETWDITIA